MSSLKKEACFTSEGASVRCNLHDIRECGDQQSFSFNVLLVILQNIVVLHNPLSFRLTSEGYIALLKAILQQILEDVPSYETQDVVLV
jgi:hypothetical protein